MKQQRLSLRNYLAYLVVEVAEMLKQESQDKPHAKR